MFLKHISYWNYCSQFSFTTRTRTKSIICSETMQLRSLLSDSYSFPPPPPVSATGKSGIMNLDEEVSPSLLLIIIILAIIFFVSGLLHLLVRFLLRSSPRTPQDFDNVTALQGQLQQLFHLHDSGVDQSFIDTLPVFNYKAIIGLKNPFDCAVCLSEFEGEDKLRLLPKCSHAFHMDCIDTWLLSHSTCPLCRGSLLLEFSSNTNLTHTPNVSRSRAAPVVRVLESGSENDAIQTQISTNSHPGFSRETESGIGSAFKLADDVSQITQLESGKVVPVKLGKFRNVDLGESSNNNDNVDAKARRCFSMGSFEYVMDENSLLRVPIRTPVNNNKKKNKQSTKKSSYGHRPALSECDCESTREFQGFEAAAIQSGDNNNEKAIVRSKKESFSISKIWLRGKKQSLPEDSPRRAFSSRFPNMKNDCHFEFGLENEIEEETRSNDNASLGLEVDTQLKTPSFARRTLLWLSGRQNKVVDLPNDV